MGRNTTKLKPPPGSRRVSDWTGLRVSLTRNMSNSYGSLASGTTGSVEYHFPRGIEFVADRCPCCGVSLRINGLDHNDVATITTNQKEAQ